MCGIVAAIARRNVVPILIEGLRRLEYRGYDSAGVAVINGSLKRVRSCGRVAELKRLTDEQRRSEEHTSELQSLAYLVCRLLLEKKNKILITHASRTKMSMINTS